MSRLRLIALGSALCAGLLAGGCIAEQAKKDCRLLVAKICENSKGCMTQEACEKQMEEDLPCDKAVSREPSFAHCIKQIEGSDCAYRAALGNAQCAGVIKVEE